jgi:hypothetical protein
VSAARQSGKRAASLCARAVKRRARGAKNRQGAYRPDGGSEQERQGKLSRFLLIAAQIVAKPEREIARRVAVHTDDPQTLLARHVQIAVLAQKSPVREPAEPAVDGRSRHAHRGSQVRRRPHVFRQYADTEKKLILFVIGPNIHWEPFSCFFRPQQTTALI